MLELTDSLKALLQETGKRLKGHERRQFMAHISVQDKTLK
jgi:hypothetical protein